MTPTHDTDRTPLREALILAIVPTLAAIVAQGAVSAVQSWIKRAHKARLARAQATPPPHE